MRCLIWSQYRGHIQFSDFYPIANGLSTLFGNLQPLLRCFATCSSQILPAFWTYIDRLIDQAQKQLCSCMHLSFMTRYMLGLSTEPGFHSTIYHLGHDVCKEHHSYNIKHMDYTLICLLAWTQALSTVQGKHNMTYSPTLAYIVQGAP